MRSGRVASPRTLAWVLAVLMAAQAVLGLLFAAEYRDVAWIAATWWGNDWVTLVVAVPLLSAGLLLAARGSVRGQLLEGGVLAYAAYNYAYYLLGAALNRFFALYLACLVVAVAALALLLADLDAAGVAAAFGRRTPVRLIGGYFVFTAAGLSAVWLGTWAAYAFAGRPTPVEPEAFKLVAALDMSLMVPALAVSGVMLARRRPWGYVWAALAGVQASLYLLVLSVNSAVAISRGLVEAPGELTVWLPLLLATATATVALFVNVRGTGTAGDSAGQASSR